MAFNLGTSLSFFLPRYISLFHRRYISFLHSTQVHLSLSSQKHLFLTFYLGTSLSFILDTHLSFILPRSISLFHPTKVHLSLFLHIIYLRSFLSKSLSSIFVSLYRHAFSLSVHIISIHGSINHFPYLLLLRRMSFFARKYYYIFRVCLNSLSFPTVKPLTISLFLRLPTSMSIYTFTAFLNTSCTFSLLSFQPKQVYLVVYLYIVYLFIRYLTVCVGIAF